MYKGVDRRRGMKARERMKRDINNKEKKKEEGDKNKTKGEMEAHANEGCEPPTIFITLRWHFSRKNNMGNTDSRLSPHLSCL